MGAVNLLFYEGVCPRCGFVGRLSAQIKLGNQNSEPYEMGEELRWHGEGSNRRIFQPSEAFNIAVRSWAECPSCHEWWFVLVTVVENRIVGAETLAGPFEEDAV